MHEWKSTPHISPLCIPSSAISPTPIFFVSVVSFSQAEPWTIQPTQSLHPTTDSPSFNVGRGSFSPPLLLSPPSLPIVFFFFLFLFFVCIGRDPLKDPQELRFSSFLVAVFFFFYHFVMEIQHETPRWDCFCCFWGLLCHSWGSQICLQQGNQNRISKACSPGTYFHPLLEKKINPEIVSTRSFNYRLSYDYG